jgi:hypothetical protein
LGKASPAEQLQLWIWCLSSFIGTVGLFIYLPMSTLPSLEQLSEQPTLLTAVYGVSTAICVGIWVKTRSHPIFSGALKTPLLVGTLAAAIGFSGYCTYVYAFSQTLATADQAPQIGEMAPDFEITDPEGFTWSLDDFRGTPVLLVFYRGHW